jgi:hypothetical protein
MMQRLTTPFRLAVAATAAALLLLTMFVAGVSILKGDSPALIVSDGKAYYVWARSVLIDRDIDFENDYRLIYPPDPLPPEASMRTSSGRVLSKTPVGMGLLEAPGVIVATAAARLFGLPEDGVSLPYQVAVCGLLVVLYITCWLLLFRAMIRCGAGPWCAYAFWVGMMGATNLIHYVTKEPAMAHAAGAALGCLIVFLIGGRALEPTRVSPMRATATGVVLGLMIIVRNANAAFIPFVLALLADRREAGFRTMLNVFLSAAAVLLLQPAASWALWGEPGYHLYPGESFTHDWRGLFLGLVSRRHGLFVYHPWYLLLIGVNFAALVSQRKHRWIFAGALATWVILAVGNGLWWCWWFGDGFGNRAFVESLAPLSYGAAVGCAGWRLPRHARHAAAAAFGLCCLLNAYIWTGYLLNRYAQNGDDSMGRVYGWIGTGVTGRTRPN